MSDDIGIITLVLSLNPGPLVEGGVGIGLLKLWRLLRLARPATYLYLSLIGEHCGS